MLGTTTGSTLTINGALAGSGSWQFSVGSSGGAGIVTLNAAAAATGLTIMNQSTTGVIRLGATNALSSGDLRFGNATGGPGPNQNTGSLDLNGFNQSVASLASAGTGSTNGIANTAAGLSTLTVTGSAITTYAGTIGNPVNVTNLAGSNTNIALALSNTHTGNLTLTGVNAYTGATAIDGGTLSVSLLDNGGVNSGIGKSSNAATNLQFGGGTLQYTGTGATASTDRNFTVNAGGGTFEVTNAATNLTLSGAGLGTGSLTKSGAGTLSLTGSNTYTGTTTITNGTLKLTAGTNHLPSGTVLYLGQAGSNTTGTLDLNTGSQTIAGLNSVAGTGTFTTKNTVTSSAATAVANLFINGGGVFGVDGDATNSGVITGAVRLYKQGTGDLVLGGVNTYTGGTTVSGGTLTLGNLSNTLENNSYVTVAGTGTLALGSNSDTVGTVTLDGSGAITGTGTLTTTGTAFLLNSGTVDVKLAGAAALNKGTSGTVSLTNGGSTYTGATTIGTGVLQVATLANGTFASGIGASSSAAANLVLSKGGTLRYTGGTVSTDRSFTLGTGGGVIDVAAAAANVTVTGAGTGSTGLTKAGAGTLTLTGANGYTGGTTVSGGVLSVGDGGSTGSITGNVVNDATLAFNKAGTTDAFSGDISGAGNLIKTGSSSLTLSGTNTYTGTTTVGNGTLVVTGVQGGSPVTVNAGTLAGTGTVGAVTAGNGGTLRPGVGGTGTLNVSGAVSLASGSTLAVFGGAGNSSTKVHSTAAFTTASDTNVVIDLTGATARNTSGNYTYTIATADAGGFNGTLPSNAHVSLINAAPGYTATFTSFAFSSAGVGTNLNANFKVTPEPATVLALGAAATGLAGLVRRRRAITGV